MDEGVAATGSDVDELPTDGATEIDQENLDPAWAQTEPLAKEPEANDLKLRHVSSWGARIDAGKLAGGFGYWLAVLLPVLALCAPLLAGRSWFPTASTVATNPYYQQDPSLPQMQRSQWDSYLTFGPWTQWADEEISQGRIPQWNQYSFTGTPFWANGLTGLGYFPKYALLRVASAPVAWDTSIVVHLAMAAVAMALLSRQLGASRLGALCGGWVWSVAAPLASGAHHGFTVVFAAWLPMGLLATVLVAKVPNRRQVGFLALCVYALMTAGHVTVGTMCMFFLGWIFVFIAVYLGRREGGAIRRLVCFAAGCVLGSALAACYVYPTSLLAARSYRHNLFVTGGVKWVWLGVGTLLSDLVVLPDRSDWLFYDLYIGAFGALMAAVGVIWVVRRRRKSPESQLGGTPDLKRVDQEQTDRAILRRVLLVGFVFFSIVAGIPVLRRLMPAFWPFGFSPEMSRFVFIFVATVVIFVAIGVTRVQCVARRFYSNPTYLTSLILIVMLISVGTEVVNDRRRNPSFHGVSDPYPTTAAIDFLHDNLKPGQRVAFVGRFLTRPLPGSNQMPYRIPSVTGYESLMDRRVPRMAAAIAGLTWFHSALSDVQGASPSMLPQFIRFDLLPRTGTCYAWSVANDYQLTGAERVYSGDDGVIDEMPRCASSWVVNRYAVAKSEDAALLAWSGSGFDAFSTVVIDPAQRSALAQVSDLQEVQMGSAFIRRTPSASGADLSIDKGSHVSVKVSRSGLLVIPMSFDPGWKATINGKPVEIQRVNFNQIGVAVSNGDRFAMSYETPGWRLGWSLTWAALVVWVLLMMVPARRSNLIS